MTHKMSKDRIRFYLPCRYFQDRQTSNGMQRDVCIPILKRAFGMSSCEAKELMSKHPHGFYIVCRPSQFARFIVYRAKEGGCINGVRDLNPEIIEGPADIYSHIAKDTDLPRNIILRVVDLMDEYRDLAEDQVNVSEREHSS